MRPLPTILALVAALLCRPGAAQSQDEADRLARRAALVQELLDEGAVGEALAESAALVAEAPAATNALASSAAERALRGGTREGLVEAFQTAGDPHIFHVAGAALALLFRADAAFRFSHAALAEQVDLCRDAWSGKDWEEARACVAPLLPPSRPRGPGAWLAAGVVGFYRTCIGPAIGSRCVLEPSCSQYFLEAGRRHGLLGVPMTADRFVREPVVSHSDRWVRRPDGTWRHPDPVSDHDGWFQKEAK